MELIKDGQLNSQHGGNMPKMKYQLRQDVNGALAAVEGLVGDGADDRVL